MRAIKIDVKRGAVYEIDIDMSLQSLYKTIGCTMVERLHLNEDLDCILDEEGRLKDETDGYFSFTRGSFMYAHAGHGVLVGVDGPNWVDLPAKYDLAYAAELIVMMKPASEV